VNPKTLLDAQLHPDKHSDLIVRISGLSAVFIQLNKEVQDEIINRSIYAA
jgi:formate C-acetyltransferase